MTNDRGARQDSGGAGPAPSSLPFRLWRRVQRVWESYQGIVLLGLLLFSLVLGYVGYAIYFDGTKSVADLVYVDLQLLTFSTQYADDPSAPLNAWLQVARFMAPLVAGYSAIRALARLFRDRVDQIRARFRRRHTIVAGVGDTGLAFVRALRAGGHRVVVVDDDPANPNLAACREMRALVLNVDARQPESLVQAGLSGADHLIAVCGDDGRNAEIVLNAQRLGRRSKRPLRCLAHVVDPDLWHLLRANELRSTADSTVRFDFFNIYEHGARALLEAHPVPEGREPPQVLVLGDGPLAERVVVHLAQQWETRRSGREPMTVTLLAPRATALGEKLRAATPQVGELLDLRLVDSALDGLAVHGAAGIDGADIAYVCADADGDAVVVAQVLRSRLATAPIVVCLTRSAGLVRVLEDGRMVGPPGLRQIEPFSLLDQTCHPESLLSGVHESLAQAIHARFRDQQLADGASPEDPRLVPWSRLAPDLRQSNRSQAADIGEKLLLVGCDLVPQNGWGVRSFAFTDSELERLAHREHDRWSEERLAQGWRPGPTRDDAAKVNPLLVPWDDLPAPAREQNRRIVLAIPDLVGQAGFEIVRLRPGPEDRSWVEPVARAIHERYLAAREQDSQASTAAAASWDELPEALKDSNRAQAADIAGKCASIGCRVDLLATSPAFDGFTATEIEQLARQEHDRWSEERHAAGWVLGASGDRQTPDLVPWEDLPEPRRELDREAVRAIPEVLAVAGFTVVRDGG